MSARAEVLEHFPARKSEAPGAFVPASVQFSAAISMGTSAVRPPLRALVAAMVGMGHFRQLRG